MPEASSGRSSSAVSGVVLVAGRFARRILVAAIKLVLTV